MITRRALFLNIISGNHRIAKLVVLVSLVAALTGSNRNVLSIRALGYAQSKNEAVKILDRKLLFLTLLNHNHLILAILLLRRGVNLVLDLVCKRDIRSHLMPLLSTYGRELALTTHLNLLV